MRLLTVFNIICLSLATKLCRNCRFYVPEHIGGKYDIGDYFGKCRKFGLINTNTSEIEYSYSLMARTNENQCGKGAKYHKKRDREESYYTE